jgi:hypothetical protein
MNEAPLTDKESIHPVKIAGQSHQQWGRLGRSVLNGVIGDYLEKQNNPLAIKMAFYDNFKPLALDEDLAQQVNFPLTNKVVVLVHGLTNLETVWDFKLIKESERLTCGDSVEKLVWRSDLVFCNSSMI